jgi:hypothetical protein
MQNQDIAGIGDAGKNILKHHSGDTSHRYQPYFMPSEKCKRG